MAYRSVGGPGADTPQADFNRARPRPAKSCVRGPVRLTAGHPDHRKTANRVPWSRPLRYFKQTTTGLNIMLSIALLLVACSAENGTGRESMGEDRNAGTGIDSNAPASETSIGNSLANKRFESVEKKETGLGPDGVEMGHWVINFSSSTFEWAYSDVVESGSYRLDGNQIVGQGGNRRILGEYDPDSGILTWDETDYRAAETGE